MTNTLLLFQIVIRHPQELNGTSGTFFHSRVLPLGTSVPTLLQYHNSSTEETSCREDPFIRNSRIKDLSLDRDTEVSVRIQVTVMFSMVKPVNLFTKAIIWNLSNVFVSHTFL